MNVLRFAPVNTAVAVHVYCHRHRHRTCNVYCLGRRKDVADILSMGSETSGGKGFHLSLKTIIQRDGGSWVGLVIFAHLSVIATGFQ